MTIAPENIKLLKAEVQADTPDGGGQATAIEVVNGESNNLFPDIPEASRVYGKIELRKIYPAVATADTDVLFGAQFLFTEVPEDEKVNVCAFTTSSWSDTRNQAQKLLESYLAEGTLSAWECLEKQLKGQKALLLMSPLTTKGPVAGQNLLVIQNEGLPNEFYQYVRILKVDSEERVFYRNNGGQVEEFKVKIHTCELTDPLDYEFAGWTPVDLRSGAISTVANKCRVRETRIADAAKYFSAKKLTRPAKRGDATIHVDSVFTNLVPSTQSEAPITDLGVAGSYVGILKGTTQVKYTQYLTIGQGRGVSILGSAIAPGTLQIVLNNGQVLTDNGVNQIMRGAAQVGTIQYDIGTITWNTASIGYDGPADVSYANAFPLAQSDHSDFDKVTDANKGTVWNKTLNPGPAKGALRVTYVNSGKHYTMYDNGDGSLGGADSGVGVGSINYDTNTVTITLKTYPDVGSYILYQWGDRLLEVDSASTQDTNIYIDLDASDMVALFSGAYKLNTSPTLKWKSREAGSNALVDRVATVNPETLEITGDAVGKITKERVRIQPLISVPRGTQITLSITSVEGGNAYEKSLAVLDQGQSIEIDLSGIQEDIDPYSLAFTLPISMEDSEYAFVYQYDVSTVKTKITNMQLYVNGAVSGTSKFAVAMRRNGHIPEQQVGTYDPQTKKITLTPEVRFSMYHMEAVPVNWSGYSGVVTTKEWVKKVHTVRDYSGVPANITLQYANTTTPPKTENKVLSVVGYTVVAAPPSGYSLKPENTAFVLAGSTLRLTADGKVRSSNLDGTAAEVGSYTGDTSDRLEIKVTGLSLDPQNGPKVIWIAAGMVVRDTPRNKFAFYTPISPIRNSSFQLRLKTSLGIVSADAGPDGLINTDAVEGQIDYETGFVILTLHNKLSGLSLAEAQSAFERAPYLGDDLSKYPGMTTTGEPGNLLYNLDMPLWAYAEDITYNAVGLTYLPLSKQLLGIDPVRLPADGRVPCFRAADMVVVTANKELEIENPVIDAPVAVGETRLSTLVVEDANGKAVVGYNSNMSAGVVVLNNTFDVSLYSLPLKVKYKVQDLVLLQDVQVSGILTLNKVLAHDYSEGCVVSSVIYLSDLQARAYNKFHQSSWRNLWKDERDGDPITANYNTVFYPIQVKNDSALKERWALVFQGDTAFRCFGEFVGEIVGGTTTSDYAPINPNTGKPYFTIKKEGWGLGWVNGNVMRFNTDAANAPIWVVRTILHGQSTDTKQGFVMQLRGDRDNEDE